MRHNGENKDAYDLFYLIRNYSGGIDRLVSQIIPLMGVKGRHTPKHTPSMRRKPPLSDGPNDLTQIRTDDRRYEPGFRNGFRTVRPDERSNDPHSGFSGWKNIHRPGIELRRPSGIEIVVGTDFQQTDKHRVMKFLLRGIAEIRFEKTKNAGRIVV